ncbi:NADH:flavin oxidoreductase [Zavarzinia compransoris]|uniref:12-oxophytodienoate reductase n=1 Tax=Zavarzinia compransoris TaxID=1264899 RepID=A0A317DZB0_9PROT|nr:NADH:flavin oxidoreductase [Zavarzinia compransoris]PWR19762.1 12-oxophytodienoate reductase [Zavarzinia compransoris]TDP45136.1 2,4-dienoyl-CoA reductase-like NADH-dependent reductase (Old Yellow Enzyme family) [Zavarzinia compransoris]
MTSDASILFRPFDVKTLHMKNRVVMAPMTRDFSPNGVPGDNVVEYYRKRAAGGVGLIVTEGTTIDHPAASGSDNYPRFHGDALEGWKKVVAAVHAEGGLIAPQLWHLGMMRNAKAVFNPDVPSVGPSGLKVPGKRSGHTLTDSEIGDIIAAFAKGAVDAKAIGFDAAEFHGAHGYLIDQFFWDGTNERTDKWGGDLVARGRFGVEVVKAARAAVGPDFPLILRISQWKQQDFTKRLADSPAEWEAFITPFVDAGVDVFHCSTRRFWVPEFEGSDLNLAGWTKKLTGKPTITVGSVSLGGSDDFIAAFAGQGAEIAAIDDLVNRMEKGEFDLVAIGRALLANPDWPHLVEAGRFGDLKAYSKDVLVELV